MRIAPDQLAAAGAVLWPAAAADAAAAQRVWLAHGFAWRHGGDWREGFAQHANGPCGMLAAVHALALRRALFGSPAVDSDAALVDAIAGALGRAAGGGGGTLVLPAAAAAADDDKEDDLDAYVRAHGGLEAVDATPAAVAGALQVLTAPPGVVLFVLSLVLSRGVDGVRRDAAWTRLTPPFIGADACCEQALVNLALAGRARPGVGDTAWCDWAGPPPPVGFLTLQLDAGSAPAACWLAPPHPVWVVLAGGHYTVLWCEDAGLAAAEGGSDAVVLWHSNSSLACSGLVSFPATIPLSDRSPPPATATAAAATATAPPPPPPPLPPPLFAHTALPPDADAANRARKVKAVLDRRRTPAGAWEYLVVCERDGSMERSEGDPRGPGKWRCRDCYLREPPVWSAYNEHECDTCRECGRHVSECGVCHWLAFDELPAAERHRWTREHAPPLLKLLRTRWPRVELALSSDQMPSLFG